MSKSAVLTGAEKARWDLSCLYNGPNDARIAKDTRKLVAMIKSFYSAYRGKLKRKLGSALQDYCEITMLVAKPAHYFLLAQSVNVNDEKIRAKSAEFDRIIDAAYGDYLSFFYLELADLGWEVIQKAAKHDPLVKHLRPWLDQVRAGKDHMLTEEIEAALQKRDAFGSSAWSEFYHEMESLLIFDFDGKKYSLEELQHILTNHPLSEIRARALKCLNDGLKGGFARYSAQTLNMVIGAKEIEDEDRGYRHPMRQENGENGLSDETVESLHRAVKKHGAPLAQRYYRLKAALMSVPVLNWSDRNAIINLGGTDNDKVIPFGEAIKLVLTAYESFSPALANLVREMVDKKRIDAASLPGKESGAFNCSIVLPGGQPAAFTFMTYLGTADDVMTLAHELGHGVHGLLAGRAQGVLLAGAPTAYNETASTFGEIITFNHLKEKVAQSGDKSALLKLLTIKIEDVLNTVVRQISFSNFERRIHGARQWLSVEEFRQFWLAATQEMYGPEGDIFTYRDTDYLWTYIDHFHRPFYVYSYAFGELLTHSLYARRQALGEKFEPLYLKLLRAGSSQGITALLKPFGLDPNQPSFWKHGIEISFGAMIKEAEDLARELGYKIPK